MQRMQTQRDQLQNITERDSCVNHRKKGHIRAQAPNERQRLSSSLTFRKRTCLETPKKMFCANPQRATHLQSSEGKVIISRSHQHQHPARWLLRKPASCKSVASRGDHPYSAQQHQTSCSAYPSTRVPKPLLLTCGSLKTIRFIYRETKSAPQRMEPRAAKQTQQLATFLSPYPTSQLPPHQANYGP